MRKVNIKITIFILVLLCSICLQPNLNAQVSDIVSY